MHTGRDKEPGSAVTGHVCGSRHTDFHSTDAYPVFGKEDAASALLVNALSVLACPGPHVDIVYGHPCHVCIVITTGVTRLKRDVVELDPDLVVRGEQVATVGVSKAEALAHPVPRAAAAREK